MFFQLHHWLSRKLWCEHFCYLINALGLTDCKKGGKCVYVSSSHASLSHAPDLTGHLLAQNMFILIKYPFVTVQQKSFHF